MGIECSVVTPSEDTAFDMADCLERVRRKDEPAARVLVERLYPLVIKVVRANLPRRASEEDLAQEIFLKVFVKLDQFRSAVPIEHWVSRIAVNHCLKALRAQKARPEWRMADLSKEEADTLEALSTSSTDAPHPADAVGAVELVSRLLDMLSPEDRLIIRLLEMEDRSVEEIRRLTGWSATVIRVRAFRARRKLNKRFAKLKKEGKL
ncbi:MAG: RNA polymerase sigma factor [Verrucomicrobia bacterium]|nr:RNA polymerase sigma factor [Verrucomicrobiota bacterium]